MVKLFDTLKDLRTDIDFHGLSYSKLQAEALNQLRWALGVRKVTSKYDVLMHATFDLAMKENVKTRIYERKEKRTKLLFGFDELKYVTKEIEKKYNLIDQRTKQSQVDIILKAVVMLMGEYESRFRLFGWCNSTSRSTIGHTVIKLDPVSPKGEVKMVPCGSPSISVTSSGYVSDNLMEEDNSTVVYGYKPIIIPPQPFYY